MHKPNLTAVTKYIYSVPQVTKYIYSVPQVTKYIYSVPHVTKYIYSVPHVTKYIYSVPHVTKYIYSVPQVDEDEYLELLPERTQLMLLARDQLWSPTLTMQGSVSTSCHAGVSENRSTYVLYSSRLYNTRHRQGRSALMTERVKGTRVADAAAVLRGDRIDGGLVGSENRRKVSFDIC
jgi:hypothetical protein